MKSTYLLPLFLLSFSIAYTQVLKPDIQGTPMANNFEKSEIHSTAQGIFHNPTNQTLTDWQVQLTQLGIKHASEGPKAKLDSIRAYKNALKMLAEEGQTIHGVNDTEPVNGFAVDPTIGASFKGNHYSGTQPPDNHVAVSDNGNIVAVANSTIYYFDENGNNNFSAFFGDFYSFLDLSGSFFDPKILYDPSEDKYILVVLSGNTPANSTVVVSFSVSNNPADGWWSYIFNGDILEQNTWFDYPSIGISDTELFISGNLFDSNDIFNQALLFQIEKSNGFIGGNIDYGWWFNLTDANNNLGATLCPVSYGFDNTYGPGIYMVSSFSFGGSNVMLWEVTNRFENNPSINVYSVSIDNYSVAGSGLQLGSNQLIRTNDCRILTGFYANSTIHFVMNTDFSNGYAGLYYGRLNVNNQTAQASRFGLEGYDYAFPSVAPFSNDPQDQTVVLGFLRTGNNIYPQFRVATCDNDFDWSGSLLVKQGEGFIDFVNGSEERWGDYSGISRRHSDGSVWISGCYGVPFENNGSNLLTSWVAEINPPDVQQAPAANFTANLTTINAGGQVTFTDQSTNSPTSWSWSFPGGNPANSNLQNPSVSYSTPGVYNVTLTAGNAAGNDVETKFSYITVNSVQQAPTANFFASPTTINAGGIVNFTDQSTNSPTSWSWSFSGGIPSNSNLQNPTISYPTPGLYSVTLTSGNAAGSDAETKVNYITVNNVQQVPVTDFIANPTTINEGGFVNFTDQSTNSPTSWSWSFPGGNPASSNLQFPNVTYPNPGVYNVSLTTGNAAGNDTETKSNYITVNSLEQVPIANFIGTPTVIDAGGLVNFIDQSSNNPTAWTWSFPGGNPSTSNLSSPSISYPSPGVYNVSLVAANGAGNDAETKTGYITVNSLQEVPLADFTADPTTLDEGGVVSFTDLSTNDPTAWSWSFPGGSPSTSDLQNPIIIYPNAGIYDVSLVVTNNTGNNASTKTDYITVLSPNSINTLSEDEKESLSVFPNPVTQDRFQVKFKINERRILDFLLYDKTGRLVKHLLHHHVKQGENLFSFNINPLSTGLYYLVIKDVDSNILNHEKIIITH